MIRFLPTLIVLLSLSPTCSFHASDVQDDNIGLNCSSFLDKTKNYSTVIIDSRMFEVNNFLTRNNTFWLSTALKFDDYLPYLFNGFNIFQNKTYGYLLIIDYDQYSPEERKNNVDNLKERINNFTKKFKGQKAEKQKKPIEFNFNLQGYNDFPFDDNCTQNQTFKPQIRNAAFNQSDVEEENNFFIDVSFPYLHQMNQKSNNKIINGSLAVNMNQYINHQCSIHTYVNKIIIFYYDKTDNNTNDTTKNIRIISAQVHSAKFFLSTLKNQIKNKMENESQFERLIVNYYEIYNDEDVYMNYSKLIFNKQTNLTQQRIDYFIRDYDYLKNQNQIEEAPVIMCFITHAICTSFFVFFVYKKRNQYPHKPNSPLLTCTIQISLFLANMCLMLGRIAMVFGSDKRNTRQLCQNLYYNLGFRFQGPDLIYTFLQQVLIFSFLLKLLRIRFAFRKKQSPHAQKILKNQIKLLLLSFIWGLIIMGIQIIIKNIFLVKGFQFYTFLCDTKCSNQGVDKISFGVYIFRMLGYLIPFSWAFYQTFEIDKKLNFGFQYFFILMLYYVPFFSQIFLHFDRTEKTSWFICENSAAFFVYYMSLLCNLSISFFMLLLHIFSYQEEDFRLDFPELLKARDLSYIFKQNVDCKVSFEAFCKHEGKSDIFDCYLNVIDDDLDQYEDEEEDYIDEIMKLFNKYELIENDIQKLKTKDPIIYKRLTENSSKLELAKIRRQYAREMLSQTVIEWEETEAYKFIIDDMQQNERKNKKMEELNLV